MAKGFAMLRSIGWSAAAVGLGVLLWQSISSEPVLPHWVSSLALAAACGIAGLRIASDSAARYIADLQRLNKFMAAQNRELEAANAMLLSQISEEAEMASEKAG